MIKYIRVAPRPTGLPFILGLRIQKTILPMAIQIPRSTARPPGPLGISPKLHVRTPAPGPHPCGKLSAGKAGAPKDARVKVQTRGQGDG